MTRFFGTFLAAGLMVSSGAATAQVDSAGLKAPFEHCRLNKAFSVSPSENKIALSRKFDGCFPTSGDQSVSIFVDFTPAISINGGSLPENKRKNLLKAVRSFFVSQTKSVSVVLILTIERDNMDPIPLDVVPLVSFDIDDKDGLHFDGNVEDIQNRVGYRYSLAGNGRVRARVAYIRSREMVGSITQRIEFFRKKISPIGFLATPVADRIIGALPSIEKSILDQFSVDDKRAVATSLDVTAGAVQAVEFEIGIGPSTATRGILRVGMEALPSILIDNVVDQPGKPIDLHVATYSATDTAKIAGRYVMGEQLRQTMIGLMGADRFSALSSTDAATFDAACTALDQAVQSPALGLNALDKTIVRWAFLASNPNVKLAAIRATPCLSTIETSGTFKNVGLPLPPIAEPPLPAAFQSIIDAANAQFVTAAPAIANAHARAAAGDSAESQLFVQNPPPAYANASYAGFRYSGEKLEAGKTVVGVYVTTDPGVAGNRYSGELLMPTVVPHFQGSGTYHYADKDPQARERYTGQFNAGLANGYGELVWKDGRIFIGSFVNGDPSGIGTLVMPNGSRQFGSFSNGKLSTMGVERAPDGKYRYGYWTNGQLINPTI